MNAWSKAKAILEDSDRLLSVTRVVVETLDDLVIEVKNSYRDVVDIINDVPEEPVEEEPYVETESVFSVPPVSERASKVKYIQQYLRDIGVVNTPWYENHHTINDNVVNAAHRAAVRHTEIRKEAAEKLNNNTEGNDRFSRVYRGYDPR